MKRTLALFLSLLLIASLAACGGGGSSSSPAADSGSAAAPSEAAPSTPDAGSSAEPAPTDADKSGGTIHMPIPGDPSTFLAWRMRNDIEDVLTPILFEPLMRCDENGEPQPFLLDELIPDAEAKTYTLKVKPGVKFHDGSVLDAETVRWNIQLYLDEGILASSFYKSVESVEAQGDDTVIIHMANWDSLLPYAMTRTLYMTSKVAYEAGGEEGLEAQPVGTGAFQFDKWEHGSSITFTRFDDYWQGKPYLDSVVADIYGNSLVIQAAMEAGDLHVFTASDYDQARTMAANGFDLIRSAIPSQAYTLNFNSYDTTGPLADVNVRKAISHAINKQAIVDALTGDFAQPSTQWSLPGNVQFNADVVGFDYDPEKAKQMLTDAGYPDGIDLNLTCKSDDLVVDTAQILIEQLAAVNVRVTLNPLEPANYSSHISKWDGLLFHQMNVWSSQYSQMSAPLSAGVTTGLGVEGFAKIPDIENTLALARSTGGAESQATFQQAVQYIFEEYCMMNPIFVTQGITVVSSKLHDCGIGAITPGYYTLHKAWLEQ